MYVKMDFLLLILLSFLMTSGTASGMNSVSFEDEDTGWDATVFERVASFTDKAGNRYYPTDGLWMMRVTDTYGAASLAFTSTDTSLSLSVDINLIDPLFILSTNTSGNDRDDLAAMILWINLYDSSGKIVMFDILPFPSAANRWQTFSAPLTNLTAGETYKLEISTEPNGIMCIQIDGFECPGVIAGGTVLLDNIRLINNDSYNNSPDIILTVISDPPPIKKRGSRFKVANTVMNQKDRISGKYTINYYLSFDTVKDDSDISLKGKRTVKELHPGESSARKTKVAIPKTTSPGNYYLIVCADDRSNITVSDEDNNCMASSTTIEVK
jgi:hypothetical protein